jgi:hypothetical protein
MKAMKPIHDRIFSRFYFPVFLLLILPVAGLCSGLSTVHTAFRDSVKNAESTEVPSKWHFDIHPSLGMTLGTTNYESVKTSDLQWLGTLNSDIDYLGKKWDFSTSLFVQYGQSKKTGEPAEKIKDAFILSLTPSIPVIKKPAIRLFLETTAETTLGKGTLQNNPTGFCDPLFLYQTLFLGQKHYSYQKNDRIQYDFTYGLGYAFQQTFNNQFQIQDSISGQKQGFESGFSGLFEFKMDYAVSKNVSFSLNTKALALSRESIFSNFDSARKSILLSAGIFYRKVGLEYNYHYVNDQKLSDYPMTDQSLMLTLRL